MSAKGIFIAGAGTDAGKTYIACAAARYYKAAGKRIAVRKPVMSGFAPAEYAQGDAAELLRACGEEATPEAVARVAPLRFTMPQSPDIAAAAEGRELFFADVLAASVPCQQSDITLVEGIGGVMTPLTSDHMSLDWIARARLPVLLAAGCYLGGISHLLTAIVALRSVKADIAGVIISEAEGALAASAPAIPSFVASAAPHIGDVPLIAVARDEAPEENAAFRHLLESIVS